MQRVLRRDLTEKGDVGTKTSRGSHPAVKDERSKEMKWSVQRLRGIRGTARRLEQDGREQVREKRAETDQPVDLEIQHVEAEKGSESGFIPSKCMK